MSTAREQSSVNIAVAGSGYWGKNLVRNFSDLGALRTICDLQPEILSCCSTDYHDARLSSDFDGLLQDPEIDAIALATPAETHFDLGRRALLAGKDLFVEKPLALTSADGRELASLASELDRILMVGHLLHYHPAVIKIDELLREGVLGDLFYLSSNRLNLGKVRREENVLWSFAPHDVSIMLMLAGELPQSVSATGGAYLQQEIYDTTITSLSYPSGIRAHIYVSWLHPFKDHKMVIIGSRKMLVFDDLESREKIRLYDKGVEIEPELAIRSNGYEVIPFIAVEPLRAECEHFLQCVISRATPKTDGESGVAVLSVLEAAQASLYENGRPVPIQRTAGTTLR